MYQRGISKNKTLKGVSASRSRLRSLIRLDWRDRTHLNTHTMGAFYEAFDPGTARALVRRIDFRHTPKHGSWLNIAENELSALTRQCVQGRRFPMIEVLREETAAWWQHTNDNQRVVDWQFRIDDARIKLKSVYPKIKS